ncbi:hypothetical protein [Tenacibaculum sp.]|uniref:hypothetical protein n=1 Tax=Tenacibaculum TaxID=104267 RepID=UPI0018283B0F|nr:hypothetical protein [Tenacibaculum sp.]NVK09215.1 hypothetical protein [Tenacibaculum sp.]
MARVLYWNIQQFGINKINNPFFNRRQIGSTINMQQASTQRAQLILDTMTSNIPDIFVVIETSTGGGVEGSLITAGGQQGALDLLAKIRANAVLGANWMLVPPLILGQGGVSEGISVFYNSANLSFTGPWGWQGAANPSDSVANIGIGNLVGYAAPWNNCLPAVAVPGGSNVNPGINSNQLAGQWLFTDNAMPPNRLQFPGIGNRPPYLTTFWDAANARTIKLLAYHAPPNFGPAANGTNQLSNVREMTNNLAANEAGVIVGDFNVNIFNAYFEPIAYNNLINLLPAGAGYTRAINPTANNGWPDKGYVFTHMKHKYRNGATPWETNEYPAYGYLGSNNHFAGYDSIDNVLTRYGAAAAGPAANITIVNRITGSPYNAVMPTPGGAPPGHYAYTTGMAQIPVGMANAGSPVALPLPPNGPNGDGGYTPGNIGALRRFLGWDNYGKIRSTSDHLPLIIDI